MNNNDNRNPKKDSKERDKNMRGSFAKSPTLIQNEVTSLAMALTNVNLLTNNRTLLQLVQAGGNK
mgnify:CR=1 FL=1